MAVVIRIARKELNQWRKAAAAELKPLSRWCRETMNAALREDRPITNDDSPPAERRLFVQIYCSLLERDAWRAAADRHGISVSSLCRRLFSERAAACSEREEIRTGRRRDQTEESKPQRRGRC